MIGEPTHTTFEMVPRVRPQLYRLKSEVSNMFHCQLCYTVVRIKNHSKNTSATQKKGLHWCRTPQLYKLSSEREVSIMLHCWLCSTCHTAVRIKNCSKSTSAIEVATMKNPHYEGKLSYATTKSTLFAANKHEWDIKEEDTGKSMKNALCILRYAKRHLLG